MKKILTFLTSLGMIIPTTTSVLSCANDAKSQEKLEQKYIKRLNDFFIQNPEWEFEGKSLIRDYQPGNLAMNQVVLFGQFEKKIYEKLNQEMPDLFKKFPQFTFAVYDYEQRIKGVHSVGNLKNGEGQLNFNFGIEYSFYSFEKIIEKQKMIGLNSDLIYISDFRKNIVNNYYEYIIGNLHLDGIGYQQINNNPNFKLNYKQTGYIANPQEELNQLKEIFDLPTSQFFIFDKKMGLLNFVLRKTSEESKSFESAYLAAPHIKLGMFNDIVENLSNKNEFIIPENEFKKINLEVFKNENLSSSLDEKLKNLKIKKVNNIRPVIAFTKQQIQDDEKLGMLFGNGTGTISHLDHKNGFLIAKADGVIGIDNAQIELKDEYILIDNDKTINLD